MKKTESIVSDCYLDGSRLYGDDFCLKEILQWFDEESEGYANLGAKNEDEYEYQYHAQNVSYGYRHIGNLEDMNVLSIGGAYGDELLPIVDKIRAVSIIEPSVQLRRESIGGIGIDYVDPEPSGKMLFKDNTFDLVTCFGVLHHIPNVSYVLSEIARVLSVGGVFLVREPIVSMGDWGKPRGNLTKNERGIPLALFEKMVGSAGLMVERRTLCYCKPFDRIFCRFVKRGKSPYNSSFYVRLDSILSKVFYPNYRYHADSVLKKIRPVGVFFVLRKRA